MADPGVRNSGRSTIGFLAFLSIDLGLFASISRTMGIIAKTPVREIGADSHVVPLGAMPAQGFVTGL